MVFQVTAVARSADSPIGRVDGIDKDGRTIEVELTTSLLERVRVGSELVADLQFINQDENPQQFRELKRLLSAKG